MDYNKDMSTAKKARDYLVSQGLAKPGRGRFSSEAKAALVEAIASGMTFTDFVGEGVVKEPSYDPAPMTYPNGTAAFKIGGKVSMKEACNGCGYSLYWCECHRPRVYGREVVISPN